MRQIDQKYIKLSENQFKIEDLKELQTIILEHSDLYYNKQNPIISDKEYDILFKKLQNLEVKFKIKDKLSLKI
jgi:DNA ligase (NAD+)